MVGPRSKQSLHLVKNNRLLFRRLTESGYNTKLIKNKREIHTNVCFHVRKNSTQLFYEYGIEKIYRFKAFLKCRVAKCKSRLIVNYGDALTTEKITTENHDLDRTDQQNKLMIQLKNLSDVRKHNYRIDYDCLESSDSEPDSESE